jgi:hypothetical protein
LYAVQLVAGCFKGYDVVLKLWRRDEPIRSYILAEHKLEGIIVLEGNQNQIIKAYQNSRRGLPSESEVGQTVPKKACVLGICSASRNISLVFRLCWIMGIVVFCWK